MTEVVAALIWEGDRFLACQRPAHKARGLLWEFVGGKVEPGETHEQALVRECREELGVTVAVGECFLRVVHEYPDLTVEEMDAYPFCPADEVILQALREGKGRP